MRPLHKTELPLFSDRKVQAAHETAQNEDSEPKASAHNRIAMLAAVYKIVNPSAVYMGAFVDRKLLGQVDEAVNHIHTSFGPYAATVVPCWVTHLTWGNQALLQIWLNGAMVYETMIINNAITPAAHHALMDAMARMDGQ